MSKILYCLFDATQWQNRLENEEREFQIIHIQLIVVLDTTYRLSELLFK